MLLWDALLPKNTVETKEMPAMHISRMSQNFFTKSESPMSGCYRLKETKSNFLYDTNQKVWN